MTPTRQSRRLCALVTASIFSLAIAVHPASAQNIESYFSELQQQAQENGNALTFGSMDTTGADSVNLKDVKLTNTETGDSLSIASLSLEGVESDDGKVTAFETATANELVLTGTGTSGVAMETAIGSFSATGFSMQGEGSIDSAIALPFDIRSGRMEVVKTNITTPEGAKITIEMPFAELTGSRSGADGSNPIDTVTAPMNGRFETKDGGKGEFTLGPIEIVGFQSAGRSGFEIESLEIGPLVLDGTDKDGKSLQIDAQGLTASNAYYPDFSGDAPMRFPEAVSLGTFGPLTAIVDGIEFMSIAGATFRSVFDDNEKTNSSSVAVDDIRINVKDIPVKQGNGAGKQRLLALGFDTINLDLSLDGVWDVDDGILDIQSYRFAIENGGAFDLSTRILGYDEAFARKFAQLSQIMNETSDKDTQQALAMQMLAEASGLSVDSLALALSDDSLTRKLLAQQAAASGQTADDMAAALPFMAGAMLAQFNVPEFAASVSQAVGEFLKNPGTITLAANPQEPVSVAEIMGIAAGVRAGNVTPAQVIERLNIVVSANCSEEDRTQESVEC